MAQSLLWFMSVVFVSILLKGIWEPMAAAIGRNLYGKVRELAVVEAMDSLDSLLLPQIMTFLDEAILKAKPSTAEETERLMVELLSRFDLAILVEKAVNETIV